MNLLPFETATKLKPGQCLLFHYPNKVIRWKITSKKQLVRVPEVRLGLKHGLYTYNSISVFEDGDNFDERFARLPDSITIE